MRPARKRTMLVGVLLVLWLALTACSCGNVIDLALDRDISGDRQAVLTETKTPTQAPAPTATLLVPTKVATSVQDFVLPDKPNTDFTFEVTQDELNRELAGQTLEQDGVTIRDVQITITAQELIANFHATHAETGLDGGLTVRGVPVVADGKVYLKVQDVELDESFKGLTRILAQAAVEAALVTNSTAQGIEIPVDERVEVKEVQLAPGKMIVSGRTR